METHRGTSRVARSTRVGLHTTVVGNSAAFGFSITITASYGALNQLAGSPSFAAITAFAICAAGAFTVLQACTTHGFRESPGIAERRIVLLGTALDVISVAVGLGAAALSGLLLPSGASWPVGGFCAALLFSLCQASELTLAARLEGKRDHPEDDREDSSGT